MKYYMLKYEESIASVFRSLFLVDMERNSLDSLEVRESLELFYPWLGELDCYL